MPTPHEEGTREHDASLIAEDGAITPGSPFITGSILTDLRLPFKLTQAADGLVGDDLKQITKLGGQISHIARILALRDEWRIADTYFKINCDELVLVLVRARDDPSIQPLTLEQCAVLVDGLEAHARQTELKRQPESESKAKELATLQAAVRRCNVPVGKLRKAVEHLTKGEPLRALLPHGPNACFGPLRLPRTENIRPNEGADEEREYRGTVLTVIPEGRRLELTDQKTVVVPPGQDLNIFKKGDAIKFKDAKPREVKRLMAMPSLPIEIEPPPPDLFAGLPSPNRSLD